MFVRFQRLYIIGPNLFNNKMFASQIKEVTGILPKCISEGDVNGIMLDNDCLVICDCNNSDANSYCSMLSKSSGIPGNSPAIVLTNVERNRPHLADEIIKFSIRGVFYSTDDFDQFSKGIKLILHGDYWISKALLVQALQSVKELSTGRRVLQENLLTNREVEILRLIVNGFSNCEIANKLFISTNTVKTHVSNLYKKIDVSNRVQAILWAAENLDPNVQQIEEDPSVQRLPVSSSSH